MYVYLATSNITISHIKTLTYLYMQNNMYIVNGFHKIISHLPTFCEAM